MIVQALLSNNSESIYFKNLDSKFIAVSDFHARYFGVESSKNLIGKSDFDFFTKQHAMAAYNDEQEIINTGKPIVGKIEQESWQGNYVSYVVTSKYPFYDASGQIIGTWGHSVNLSLSEDIGIMKHEKAEPRDFHMNYTEDTRIDSLTFLNNSKAFYEMMNIFYQEAMNSLNVQGQDHILILVDMNDFRSINTTFGHQYGDNALIFASKLLSKLTGGDIHLFRYGGDEFAYLIENTPYNEAVELCSSIVDLFDKNPYVTESSEIKLTASIGMSKFKESLPFGNIHDIINLTDKRLYTAKKEQKPTCIFDDTYK